MENLTTTNIHLWKWKNLEVAWKKEGSAINAPIRTVLIHGFGASKEHWRHNQSVWGEVAPCYAIDLIGFGDSSQPLSQLKNESNLQKGFTYNFDNWSNQVKDFCQEIVQSPVLLIGNSIGGVIALKAAKILGKNCLGVILIDCAQRTMDDKRLLEQPMWMRLLRPGLKKLVQQRWLSRNLFQNAAQPSVIKNILKKAYPSGQNIDEGLINLLHKPSQRPNADEAFRGFINLFDDYLAPELMEDLKIPVDLIWGEKDPWEPVKEAQKWFVQIPCIRSLEIIPGAGHCPHDELPDIVNPLILKIIQQAT